MYMYKAEYSSNYIYEYIALDNEQAEDISLRSKVGRNLEKTKASILEPIIRIMKHTNFIKMLRARN